ncbi:pitrilysin family protein [Maritimibacter sp. UBA3975]|uniref:M16 family metallopeptidase n=1 Tax=Maritimibacter sp. UBA3975 TaxID=1946833 RepID=UPI000C0A3FE9|nr:pitrilysin family protein [Maritimibacter sp. UBA3975]MAM63623.1 peptidase M16 [Maritimibacter sp.]|tara:strand:- start:26189 stop:27544 length:1356 start_codon:yes stop_codon:yes gene_type:complete
MTRLLSACLALIAFTIPATAQDVTDYTLDNGMEVVVIEDHRAPVVVHMVWYRAGSADEEPGVSGIAHFLEHLLFKATDDLESGELSRVVAENGGSDNAFTSADYTAYFQRIAADRLELMMTMEADRMRDLQLSEADIKTERDVILEERAMRTDNSPGALLNEQMQAALYMNHPYGTPNIGWRHEMEELGLEDALAYYRKYYAPNNAILVVAGDVEPENVLELARKHYGPLEPTEGLEPRDRPKEPVPLAERRITYSDPRVGQPYVIRTYLAPERNPGAQEEAAALVYLSEILGGNPATSVFGQALQFESNVAVSTFAGYSPLSLDISSLRIGIVPSQGVSLEEAEAAMDGVLKDFFETGIDPEQFERIKTRIRANDIYAQDSMRGLANRYGAALTSGLTIEDVKAWPDVLQSVTPDDVMKVAEKVLQRSHAVTGWLTVPETSPEPEAEVSQ